MTAIDVSENNERYSDINGVLFNKEKTQLIKCPASYASYVIPGHVTNIKDQAFRGCVNLISIEIPESVSIIYDATFYRCTNLTSIILHDNITVIKASAFFNCSSLKSIKLPTNITKISAYTMGSCLSLESVYIPDTVTAIDDNAFYNCSKLKDIYYAVTKEEWYAITIGVSNECLTNATIHYNSSASTAQTLSLPRNKTASVPDSVQTYTYSNAVPDTKYLIMAVNDNETENILSSDNLLYIDQQTADESGSVTFNYIAPDDCTYIFIGDFGKGEYCRVAGNIISSDTEHCTICNSTTDDDNSNHNDAITTTTITSTTTTESTITITSTTTTTEPINQIILGDVNEDGLVDALDASLTLSEYANLSTGGNGTFIDKQQSAGDVNFDNMIDASDASTILSFYAYLSTGGTESDMRKWILL